VPVIGCRTREVLGHALERTGRAKTAERALEEALLARFGTLRSAPANMLLRHDNGLVFGSCQYRAVVGDYGLKQEYTTPYNPQQNGLCERFIKTFTRVLLVKSLPIHRISQTQTPSLDPPLQPTPSPSSTQIQITKTIPPKPTPISSLNKN
jgi:putative transposase